ncbi:MAG: hypothetical protein ACRCZ0_10815 [Cetobacterium sp.]
MLNKRAKGDELVQEELDFLKEYDESLADVHAQLELEKQAKALAEEKFNSANTELQDKLKALTELSDTFENARIEKEAIEKLLETQKTTAEVQVARTKLQAEAEAKKEAMAKAKERTEADERVKAEMEDYKSKLNETQKQMDITNFKFQMMMEKASRPYLTTEIDILLSEVEVKGVELSKTLFEYFVKARNHEEEMSNFKKKQEAGTSILDGLKANIEIKEEKTISDEDRILARVKKLGLRARK